MAAPGYGQFGLTGDELVDALTHGYRWQLTADRTIDWSLSLGPFGQTWSASAQATIAQVFSNISAYANVKFNYLGHFDRPSVAASAGSEINLAWAGGELFSSSRVAGIGFFPVAGGYGLYPGDSGDIVFNVNSGAGLLPFGPGSAVYSLLIHEVGHVLGLKHTHDDGGTGRPTFRGLGISSYDVDWVSVMSYEDNASWNLLQWDPATPMALDVLALQYLYGRNVTTNAGNNTFDLYRTGFYVTLWDAAGHDTISVAAQNEGWVITLPEEQPSALVETRVGLAAPLGTSLTTLFWLTGDYEDIAGSRAADTLQGNSFRNQIRGNGGNDEIDGGAGIDTAVFSGARSQYTIERSGAKVILRGPDGTDTMTNVERLLIGSTKIAIDTNGNGGQAYRLYQAAFNRTPDQSGLGFQMNVLDSGATLKSVAQNFLNSPEFARNYGGLSDASFVTTLYQNVLHRAPDASGLTFQQNALRTGTDRAQLLVNFSESPENQAALIGVISNGMTYL